jgi:carbon-monoxide dehydrogenase small subunit
VNTPFTLNGEMKRLETRPDRRVIDVLREDLALTGTKEGCGSGECGACTILVDGETRLSCLMVAAQLHGRTVTTIEGIASEGALHLLQEAFVEQGAVQCGFCTPGMLMSGLQLLEREPDPDRAAIRRAISGNLCRCTGYQKIVDAIWAASAARRSEVGP